VTDAQRKVVAIEGRRAPAYGYNRIRHVAAGQLAQFLL
jgi:hypothetical protein